MADVSINNLCKSYPGSRQGGGFAVRVLDNISLIAQDGEFITFFGPNACGKTTLLSIVGGLLQQDSGAVTIDGQAPTSVRIGFVFQDFQASLFPWLTSLDNVALPLELAGMEKKERRQRAQGLLEEFNLEIPLCAFPYELSGGQQQLLAIARGLIIKPSVLLLDEPFNQLDYQTRIMVQDNLLDIWERTGTTALHVSHDLDEALLLGDRTVFLTQRPARVFEILTNDLPRPRRHSVVRTEQFSRLRAGALSIFERVLEQ